MTMTNNTLTSRDTAWLDSWCDWRRAADHADGTIYLHRRYVERLAEVYPLDSVGGDDLAAWMARQPWCRATRRSAKSALCGFFRWAHTHGRRDDNPALLLAPIKKVHPCPRPTPDRVVASAQRRATEQERLMLLLAMRCGLRRHEIAQLHTDDVSGRWLTIVGKGQKPRRIPVRCDELAALLEEAPDGWLFPGRFPGTHVCPDYVGRRLSKLLGTGWSGHSLRARYATTTHRGSRDVLSVQRLLGHSDPSTTLAYVEIDEDDLWRAAGHAA